MEIVDFKEPQKYTSLGGKIERRIVVGSPGTGKTLAKAMQEKPRCLFSA